MSKLLVEFTFEPEHRTGFQSFYGTCSLPGDEVTTWSVWGGFLGALDEHGKVFGYLEFLADIAPIGDFAGPIRVIAGNKLLVTVVRKELAPLGTSALLASLKPVLEPIVHHIRGTYNHWRYKTNHGRSDGVHGMKYEDAVKALPKIYDNIKEK